MSSRTSSPPMSCDSRSTSSSTCSTSSLPNSCGSTEVDRSNSTLTVNQVARLRGVLSETFQIDGKANFPIIQVQLRTLIRAVQARLTAAKVTIFSTRLNGGAASHVMATADDFPFSDVDLIFNVELTDFESVRTAVLDALLSLLPPTTSRAKIDLHTVKEMYIGKMVKVQEGNDRWSLFTLNNNMGKCVELKFVDRMRRQFEFSVDSFQLHLDPLLHETNGKSVKKDIVVPAESKYGDFKMALHHLNHRLIDTRRPEEIRGGGLLKYCHMLCRGFRPARPWRCQQLEKYMCSRFFIDFADTLSQQAKLTAYLSDHLAGEGVQQYLSLLHRIVGESTVCLMSHERQQTLMMIEQMAQQMSAHEYYEQACSRHTCSHTPRQTLLYMPRNAQYWIPVV